jgi:hypothetical protein
MNRIDGKRTTRTHALIIIASLMLSGLAMADEAPGNQDTGSITGRVFLDENADTFFEECDCDCGVKDIPVRLYKDRCAGLILQTAKTDEHGYFHFKALEPGGYCVMPDAKMICEGFQPTKSITQRVQVKPGEDVEAEWFGLDHFTDINE